MRVTIQPLFLILLASGFAQTGLAFPSLPSIPDIPVDIPSLSDIPLVGDFLEEEPAITSCLDDAVSEVPDMDNFEPEFFSQLYDMPVNSNGSIFLLPGAYELETRSYCLHAGTYVSDTGGNGYIYAPLVGDRRDIIQAILDRSSDHGEIPQRDVQVLIWAVLAKYEFTDMNSSMQRTVTALLTPDEIFELNGGYMALVPDDMMSRVFGELPEPLRAVMEAEAGLRNTLSRAGSTYEELEAIAVLPGNPPAQCNERDIPEGRWSLHPAGYYIRYFPSGYTHTRVEIWVPENENRNLSFSTGLNKAPGRELRKGWDDDWSGSSDDGDWLGGPNGIAMPGNTSRQRLLVSPTKNGSRVDTEIGRIKNSVNTFSNIAGVPTDFLGVVSMGPGYIFDRGLDKVIDLYGSAIKALGMDPPRFDYTEYAIPVIVHVDSLTPGGNLSPEMSQAMNSFVESAMALNAVMQAAQISLDRMGGAEIDNEEFWMEEQALCYVFYKRLSGEYLIETADRFSHLFDVCRSEGLQDTYITTAMASEYLSNLRSNGYSSEDIEFMHFLGRTDDQIQESLEVKLSITASEMEGSLFAAADECFSFMRECGAQWQLMPEVNPYWTEGVTYPIYAN